MSENEQPAQHEATEADGSAATRDALSDLMSQSAASFAAASAVGAVMATQAFGLWISAFSKAGEAARRGAMPQHGGESATREAKPAARPASADADLARAPATKVKPAALAAKTARRRAMPTSQGGDDLKAIAGIGPKLAELLAGKGIDSFARMASMTADEIGSLDAELGLGGRIERDGWLAQAKSLASAAKSGPKSAGRSGGRKPARKRAPAKGAD